MRWLALALAELLSQPTMERFSHVGHVEQIKGEIAYVLASLFCMVMWICSCCPNSHQGSVRHRILRFNHSNPMINNNCRDPWREVPRCFSAYGHRGARVFWCVAANLVRLIYVAAMTGLAATVDAAAPFVAKNDMRGLRDYLDNAEVVHRGGQRPGKTSRGQIAVQLV